MEDRRIFSGASYRFSIVLGLMIIAMFASGACAGLDGTLYVVNTTDDVVEADGFLSLREAVLAASGNIQVNEAPAGNNNDTDVIIFEFEDPGWYRRAIVLEQTLELSGKIYIDGSVFNPVEIRSFAGEELFVIKDSQSSVYLSGLSFEGNLMGRATAIRNFGQLELFCCNFRNCNEAVYSSGLLSASNCDFIGNVGFRGAAICSFLGNTMVDNCYFFRNTSDFHGGALHQWDGLVSISNCEFVDNASLSAGETDLSGGAVSIKSGVAGSIVNSVFTDNYSSGSGGAIDCNGSQLEIINCALIDNKCEGNGGGICVTNSSLTFEQSYVQYNNAGALGGGLYINGHDLHEIEISSCVFSANHSGGDGGGVYARYGNICISNCDIVGNHCYGLGGGLYNDAGSHQFGITVNNSIITENYNGPDGSYAVSDIFPVNEIRTNSTLIGINASFVRNPSAGPDGIWSTMDDDCGDLHLLGNSIAIGLADDDLIMSLFDIEGNLHYDYWPMTIGAYEFKGTCEQGSTVVTTADDIIDFYDGKISLREAIIYADDNKDTITFDQALSGKTISLLLGSLVIDTKLTIDVGDLDIRLDANGFKHAIDAAKNITYLDLIGLTITNAESAGICFCGMRLIVSECTITRNGNEFSDGGGIYIGSNADNAPTLVLEKSYITGNIAGNGGGIYCNGKKTDAYIQNSVFVGNACCERGAAINFSSERGELLITNSDFVSNWYYFSDKESGQWLYSTESTVRLYNSIVTSSYYEHLNYRTYFSIVSSTVFDPNPAFVRMPDIGRDKKWGTSDDDYGDLRLLPDSLAIDAGFNDLALDYCHDLLIEDIAGKPRIMGNAVDLGAYESEYSVLAADLNRDGKVDILDFLVLKNNYGKVNYDMQLPGDMDRDMDVDMFDFMIFKNSFISQ